MNLNENHNLKVKDLSINQLIPNTIYDVAINIEKGHHTIYFPVNFNGDRFKTFRKSRGGMFSKDVLNFSRGFKHGKYLLILNDTEKIIVRLIEDEEMSMFQSLKLVDGIIKDKSYMLLKTLQRGDKLTDTKKYIDKINSDDVEEVEVMNVNLPVQSTVEDDHDYTIRSISLFD
jgi:hypothetical protein